MRVFGAPLVIGFCSVGGIVLALLDDGWVDAAASLALAAPLAATAWAMARSRE